MEGTKHTPGPWKYFQPVSGTGIMYEITRFPYVNYCIGEAHTEEDARLIAAAPELLEALQALVDDVLGGMVTVEESNGLWADAIAAIAKATGSEVSA